MKVTVVTPKVMDQSGESIEFTVIHFRITEVPWRASNMDRSRASPFGIGTPRKLTAPTIGMPWNPSGQLG